MYWLPFCTDLSGQATCVPQVAVSELDDPETLELLTTEELKAESTMQETRYLKLFIRSRSFFWHQVFHEMFGALTSDPVC